MLDSLLDRVKLGKRTQACSLSIYSLPELELSRKGKGAVSTLVMKL